MTLMERIADQQCRVVDCHEQRVRDSQVCAAHLNDLYMHRLDRNDDGTYALRRAFVPRDNTDWLRAA